VSKEIVSISEAGTRFYDRRKTRPEDSSTFHVKYWRQYCCI